MPMAEGTPIAVIDYGAGNLRSVLKALEAVGSRPTLVDTPKGVEGARAIIFPGQGASPSAMRALEARGLVEPLRRAIGEGRPFLGVCLGLQLLLETSEEGDVPCLGVIPGRVRRLPPGLKVPHMGWNRVHFTRPHPVFEGIPQDAYFYFVHSYYPDPQDPSVVAGVTEYGVTFCSVVARGNLVATQFHPEKSGALGLRVYRNFVRLAAQEPVEAPWR